MKDTWDRVCVDTAEEGALGCDGDRTPTGVGRLHCVCVCVCPPSASRRLCRFREGSVGPRAGGRLSVDFVLQMLQAVALFLASGLETAALKAAGAWYAPAVPSRMTPYPTR